MPGMSTSRITASKHSRRCGHECGMAAGDGFDAVARRLERSDQDLANDRRIIDRENAAAAVRCRGHERTLAERSRSAQPHRGRIRAPAPALLQNLAPKRIPGGADGEPAPKISTGLCTSVINGGVVGKLFSQQCGRLHGTAAPPRAPRPRSVDGVADGGLGRARRRALRPGRLDPRVDEREQRVGVGGLGEVVVETGVARPLAIGGLAVAGQRDQARGARFRQPRAGAWRPRSRPSSAGRCRAGRRRARTPAPTPAPRAVADHLDLVPAELEQHLGRFGGVVVVVDDEDAAAHARRRPGLALHRRRRIVADLAQAGQRDLELRAAPGPGAGRRRPCPGAGRPGGARASGRRRGRPGCGRASACPARTARRCWAGAPRRCRRRCRAR